MLAPEPPEESMTSRARVRVGREVHYYPTAAEASSLGAGPWPATIVAVNADGSVDLAVTPPTQAGTVSQADAAAQGGAYNQADAQSVADLTNANKAAINALVAAARKASIAQGGSGGRYQLVGDPSHV